MSLMALANLADGADNTLPATSFPQMINSSTQLRDQVEPASQPYGAVPSGQFPSFHSPQPSFPTANQNQRFELPSSIPLYPSTSSYQAVDSSQALITEAARQEMLDVFKGDTSVDLNVSSFSVNSLKVYLELYFLHFDSIHPIIHRPTLALRGKPPALLLLSLVFIGTAFSDDKTGFKIALTLHSKVRHLIFEVTDFSTPFLHWKRLILSLDGGREPPSRDPCFANHPSGQLLRFVIQTCKLLRMRVMNLF